MGLVATLCLIVIAIALLPRAIEVVVENSEGLLALLALASSLVGLAVAWVASLAALFIAVIGSCFVICGIGSFILTGSTGWKFIDSFQFAEWKLVVSLVTFLFLVLFLRQLRFSTALNARTASPIALLALSGWLVFLAGLGGRLPRALDLPLHSGGLLFCSLGVLTFLSAVRRHRFYLRQLAESP